VGVTAAGGASDTCDARLAERTTGRRFAGSGSTGVAAIRLGRRFLGWEKDAGYAETARRRLALAREQLELLL
jgi:DNA modification methylase